MSLPELCLTRKMFPKRPLDRRFLSLQDEHILAKKETTPPKQQQGGDGAGLYSLKMQRHFLCSRSYSLSLRSRSNEDQCPLIDIQIRGNIVARGLSHRPDEHCQWVAEAVVGARRIA